MSYLQENFDKNDILRVVRALAIFRPSLIALQMPLTEEDEIFVEKCFQRSLLELEKLITYSGTPTVVWRRTGEICLAGLEFSMLTEWSQHDLLGQRRYIYEVGILFYFWKRELTLDIAIRTAVSNRILGEICFPCFCKVLYIKYAINTDVTISRKTQLSLSTLYVSFLNRPGSRFLAHFPSLSEGIFSTFRAL